MAAKVKYEVTATIGEYTNGQGEKKKRYQRCGTAFENENGQLSIKLDCVPVSPEWSGWFSLFEPREQGRDVPASEARRQPAGQRPPTPTQEDDEETDIPF